MTTTIKSKYRGKTIYTRVLAELVQAAQYRGTTTYQDVAAIMGLPQRGSHMAAATGQMLGEISEDEVGAGRPMLSAVVVKVTGKVGPGFFAFAQELGRMRPNEDEGAFWKREVEAVYQTWRRPLPED